MTSPTNTVVGKWYRVPCIRPLPTMGLFPGSTFVRLHWVPIIGPIHDDIEFIKFEQRHWHIDWRFAPNRLVNRRIKGKNRFTQEMALLGLPISERNTVGGLEMKWRKCLRPVMEFPSSRAPWRPALEEAFQNHRMENMICPHKGIPLHDCPVVNGAVVCCGHGLRWSIETGKLVRTR